MAAFVYLLFLLVVEVAGFRLKGPRFKEIKTFRN